MADYRHLWFGEVGGLTSAEWLEAQSEPEALAVLNLRNVRQRFKMWCDQRLVAQTDSCGLWVAQQLTG